MANCVWILTVLCTCVVQGVLGQAVDDVSGMIAAAVIGFFMLIIVITMLALLLTLDSWYPKLQMWRGKVKIPRHVIALRKARAKKAASDRGMLVAASNGTLNGKVPMHVADQDSRSWVEGWNSGEVKEYETKDVTMTLGEEKDTDEYRIEAELVDNEALDLGPYHKMSDQTVVGSSNWVPTEETQEAPIYSEVNRASKKSNQSSPGHQYEETETSFSALTADPAVVIM
ncbi:hypothetical protein SNE40_019630 [Patella caerulea]|uniref:Uncharacterized protein n=1 Tax=Patella caerulea TaxID=87958 RepID=A0AAN8J7D6_PATCE